MNEFNVDVDNENSLQELLWAIASSQGEFSLILARCNTANLCQKLIADLKTSSQSKFCFLQIEPSTTKLYQTISDSLCLTGCEALFISGLESVIATKQMLNGANQVREEFRKNLHFPVVFWVTDEVLQQFMREAPDLHSWAVTVEFTLSNQQLVELIKTTADEVFTKVLEAGSGRFVDNAMLNLQVGSSRRQELEFAWQELQKCHVNLNPEIRAGLEFVLGRDLDASMEQSRQHYERSLVLLQQQAVLDREEGVPSSPNPKLLMRQGCLLYCLGLWWRTYAVLHRAEYKQACEKAKNYFQQCIHTFELANRFDLVAKFINALGGVLQRLERWDEMETTAYKALALHQKYPDEFKLARVYGFLAEVALEKKKFEEAQKFAAQALIILTRAKNAVADSTSLELKINLDWEMSYHQGWYLYALGRSLFELGLVEDAVQILEAARNNTKPQYDPQLYIGILGKLRDSYFQKREYLTAFLIKQEQRSIQQQYGFRAFIGAGRLQPKQQVINPAFALLEQQENIAPEITASGRQRDIDNLCKRMARHDHRLTVIHGQSGVGKTSILQAGLIPALKQKSIGTREVVPVLLQVYTDWMREFAKQFKDALIETKNWDCQLPHQTVLTQGQQVANIPLLVGENFGMKHILDHFKMCVEHNLMIVVICDQLEEFFVINRDPRLRRTFYKFIRDCLDIPYVKVILSLREDYLHYLLECNNRLINFNAISNNILDNKILYYIGNFSKKHAKFFLQSLNKKTQLALEKSLIDALLKDLWRDLGEIRPIELQVVGTQLETEKINSLQMYHQSGTKEQLVERFLEEVIGDCGNENERAARLALYLLTDENGTRPIKTKAEITKDLETADYLAEIEKLDTVLEILVRSNLVLKIPQDPADCYQLVHDYLVIFVRQSQQAIEVEERKGEKEKRLYNEAKLNRSLKQQRNWAIAASLAAGILSIIAVILWMQTDHQSQQNKLKYQQFEQLLRKK